MKENQETSENKNIDNYIEKKDELNSEEKKITEEPNNQISLLEKWQNHMNLLQEKTGIKGIFIIWGLIFAIIMVYFNIFEAIITNLVGTIYPAFWTIKSIEQNEDQKKWLIYWVVFSSFILIDKGFPIIARLIPFYFVFKILFLMVLFMPGSNICTHIYYFFVKKIFGYYSEKIDSYVAGVKEYANDVFHENNLKSFKNNKTSGKKYLSLDSKNMKEDYDNDKEHQD